MTHKGDEDLKKKVENSGEVAQGTKNFSFGSRWETRDKRWNAPWCFRNPEEEWAVTMSMGKKTAKPR